MESIWRISPRTRKSRAAHGSIFCKLVRTRIPTIAFATLACAFAQLPIESVSGMVWDVASKPVPGVTVVAGNESTTTDAKGQFSITGLPPGPLHVAVIVNGHLVTTRDIVIIADREPWLEIRLVPMNRISGRVVGEDRKPLAGVPVFLVAREHPLGAIRYFFSLVALTGKDGGYQFSSIDPERDYLVLAKPGGGKLDPASDAPADPDSRERVLVPTFYPSSSIIEGAVPIVLHGAEQRDSIEIHVRSSPSYCVDGAVVSETPLQIAMNESQPTNFGPGDRTVPRIIEPMPSVAVPADGKFRICGLHTGEYQLHVFENSRLSTLNGMTSVSVARHDVTDLRITPQGLLTGQVEIVWIADSNKSEDPPKSLGTVQINIAPLEVTHGLTTSLRSKIPGHFEIPLPRGDYAVSVQGLPSGAYVKDITSGRESILNGVMHAQDAAPMVRVILASDGGRAIVQITTSDGDPVPGAATAIAPAAAASETEFADGLIFDKSDASGRWTSGWLRPGTYWAVAGEFAPVPSLETIGKLWRARTAGEKIEVRSSSTASVSIVPTKIE
jgi:hypothetical protein